MPVFSLQCFGKKHRCAAMIAFTLAFTVCCYRFNYKMVNNYIGFFHNANTDGLFTGTICNGYFGNAD